MITGEHIFNVETKLDFVNGAKAGYIKQNRILDCLTHILKASLQFNHNDRCTLKEFLACEVFDFCRDEKFR